MKNETLSLDKHVNPDKIYRVDGKLINELIDMIYGLKGQIKNIQKEANELALKEELVELRLRDKNPALKEAWDKYQTVKGLVK